MATKLDFFFSFLHDNRLSAVNITHCPTLDARLSVWLNNNPLFMLSTETFNIHCKLRDLSIYGIEFNFVDPFVFARIQAEYLEFDVYTSTEAIKNIMSGIARSHVNEVGIMFLTQDKGKIHLPLNFFDPLSDKVLSQTRHDWLFVFIATRHVQKPHTREDVEHRTQ